MDHTADHPFSASKLPPDSMILTPVEDSPSAAGRVLSHDAGAAGLAVRLTAQVTSASADRLDGDRVWVTANTDGRLIAFQSVARRLAEAVLEVNGITIPVEEHRRDHLRGATRIPIALEFRQGVSGARTILEAETVDLSRAGCRVQLSQDDVGNMLTVGSSVKATLELGAKPISISTEVLRVNRDERQGVLTFRGLRPEEAERIERAVLSLVV